MKRLGNIYDEIISIENLTQAHKNARKSKSKQKGVITFNKDIKGNIEALHEELRTGEYKTPPYKVFIIHEPKEREIFVLPYKDRIVHHAIIQKLEQMFVRTFTKNTYSCIKGRGVHAGKKYIEKVIRETKEPLYCLKIDVVKFYPSVDHDILKAMLLRKIKDKRLIKLLFEIIDSAVGLPIGNYLSQFLANFYMSYFDHWLKEFLKVKHCARYCDDIVIVAPNKKYLHCLLHEIRNYLRVNLKLEIKGNYQVFPVEDRGIDFLGYVIRKEYTLIRKSIKQACARMLFHNPNKQSIASYGGWFKHCNARNLERKLIEQLNERLNKGE